MNNKVLVRLYESGWTPDRKVPVDDWVKQLASEGFQMHSKAVEALQSYGGLEISPLNTEAFAYRADVLRFDPVEAASGEFDRIDPWQQKLGTKLAPLAAIRGGAILLLAEDGRVFTSWLNDMFLDGESLEDAFENSLIIPKRFPKELDPP